MLKVMESGNPFSIRFVTYDKQRKKGGEVREYPEAVLNQREISLESPRKPFDSSDSSITHRKKHQPNHYKNATRALRILINGNKTETIVKFHIFLVLEFNGKKMIL